MRAEILAMNVFVLSFVSLLAISPAAWAQASPPQTEDEKLRQCDRDICAIITNPNATGGPVQCDLAQTWYKEEIAKAVKKGRLSWTFGDARCTAKFEISRALFAAPFKEKTYKLKLPAHPVACEIDNSGSRHELRAKMAPVIEFENGKAKSVSLGVYGHRRHRRGPQRGLGRVEVREHVRLFPGRFRQGGQRIHHRPLPQTERVGELGGVTGSA